MSAGIGDVALIDSDGVTVWVNGVGGLLGRFGARGIDVHRPLEDQGEKGECLYCTHELTSRDDWEIFRSKMKELHGVNVSQKHRPKRFSR